MEQGEAVVDGKHSGRAEQEKGQGGSLGILEATPVVERRAWGVPERYRPPNSPVRQRTTGQEGREVTWEKPQEPGSLY